MSSVFQHEVAKRRTFAIISHPDAGKTTMTEKLLLLGRAIQVAGTVKGRKADRHATSDWMEMEKQSMIDMAINNLHEKVKAKDWEATKHVLNSQGKSRGWSDKQPVQLIGKQQNVSVTTEPNYKFRCCHFILVSEFTLKCIKCFLFFLLWLFLDFYLLFQSLA